MIKSRTKIIFQFVTIAFTTLISLLEQAILFNTFELKIIGSFFLVQSTSLLFTSAFFGFRMTEALLLLLSNKKLSKKEKNDTFSELFSFYLIVLLSLLPISLSIFLIFNHYFSINLIEYLPSVLLVLLTFAIKQLSSFWVAIQYHNNKSEKVSIFQTYKKITSLILIFFLYLLSPSKNIIFLLSTVYFANALIFFLYEIRIISNKLNNKIIKSIKNPISTFKKFIIDDNNISNILRTGYMRTLFSTWAKKGDISIAGLIAGPSGSAFLKAFNSATILIYSLINYTQPFSISYIDRNREKKNIFNFLNFKSFKLIPIALCLSILIYYFSKPIFRLIYNIVLSNSESFIISMLVLIALISLIFSWSLPLHLINNRYKLSMYISFAGASTSYLFFGFAFYNNSLEVLYFSLPVGILTGGILSQIFHLKESLLKKQFK